MIVTSGVVMIWKDSGNLTGISMLVEPKLVPESLLVMEDFDLPAMSPDGLVSCHQRDQFLAQLKCTFRGMTVTSGVVTISKDSGNLIGISIGGGAPLCPCLYIVQVRRRCCSTIPIDLLC